MLAASRASHRLVELATGPGSSSPWSSSPSPSAGSAPAPQPAPRPPSGCRHPERSKPAAGADPRPPPGCLGQRLAGMVGLFAPHDDGEKRRLLLPPARDGHPEPGPGDAVVGVADLGVVGEVAGEADAGLGHGAALPGLSGRAVYPALGTGGRWTPWHAERPLGKATKPTKSAMDQACRACSVQVPGWLVGCLRRGVGHASTVRPDPSTLGVAGERGSTTRAAVGPPEVTRTGQRSERPDGHSK
jgi:hypothetical protein